MARNPSKFRAITLIDVFVASMPRASDEEREVNARWAAVRRARKAINNLLKWEMTISGHDMLRR